MALRDAFKKLRMSTDELDREKRLERLAAVGCTPIDEAVNRQVVELFGQVQSVRIVPRAGAPAIDVTIDDGHGLALAMFFGRRSIPGVHAGTALKVKGRCSMRSGRLTLINPEYELVD